MPLLVGTFDTPLCPMAAFVTAGGALARLDFLTGARDRAALDGPGLERDDDAIAPVARQIGEYLDGTRREFDLPLAPDGNAFQQAVWTALLEIPYGRTLSYGAVARRIGQPDAARAVGRANNANPIPVVIPCHRVIGANGDLVGYGGGLPIKIALLELEGVLPRPLPF